MKGVYKVIGNVKQYTGRIDKYIPAVPAQISAKVNRKTTQENKHAYEDTRATHSHPLAQFSMYHVYATEAKQRRCKYKRCKHNHVIQQVMAHDILNMYEVADHIEAIW
jgi:hypothetical protein